MSRTDLVATMMVIAMAAAIATAYVLPEWRAGTNVSDRISTSRSELTGGCGLIAGEQIVPGESAVTSNGRLVCVVGPPEIVNPDGIVDFRNGTMINLHANLTGAGFLSGGRNDTIVLLNGTRIIFNGHEVIATLYPNQGRERFSNGSSATFPACPFEIDSDPALPRGLSANGTAWITTKEGPTIVLYPNGTCSEKDSDSSTTIVAS